MVKLMNTIPFWMKVLVLYEKDRILALLGCHSFVKVYFYM